MTTTKFEPLTAFLSKWFDQPTDDLPAEVRARIKQDFFPMPWDLLDEGERREVARQWDAQHDPTSETERERAWGLTCKLAAVKASIAEWSMIKPNSVTELEMQESKLKSFREQAAGLVAELNGTEQASDADPGMVSSGDDMAPEQAAPPDESSRSGDDGNKSDGANLSWQDHARALADEIDATDEKCDAYDSVTHLADRVAAKLKERGIKGPRGPVAGKTVMREALQGERWNRKR